MFKGQRIKKAGSTFTVAGVSLIAILSAADAPYAEDLPERAGSALVLDEIVVTAQRREQTIQDVPISVAVMDRAMLEALQIDSVADLQMSIPNVYYTKGNFSGSNMQIRGIGSLIGSSSSDTGIGVHINDVYLNSPRLFETEYFDIKRVEVLRGPQGTLYGRNATGGTVNIITARPVIGEFEAEANAQYGSYDHMRLKGMVNVPVGSKAALRVAGIHLKRDGYIATTNPDADFDSVDGRDSFAVRGSFGFEAGENTRVDIIASYFKEDDDRARTGKSLCDYDPSGVLGCLPSGNGFDSPNFSATLGGIMASNRVLGPLALYQFGTIENDPNPRDLRQVYTDSEPFYKADETFVMIDVQHDFSSRLSLNLIGAYQDTSVLSQEFSGTPTGADAIAIPAAVLQHAIPINYAAFLADGLIPVSAPHPSNTGALGGHIFREVDGIFSYDESASSSEQYSGEARLSSSFEGRFNFQLAVNYLDVTESEHFSLYSSALDYFAIVAPARFGAPDGTGRISSVFSSETDEYRLKSTGVFGELYYDLSDKVRVTGGLRYTRDRKSVRDRNLPLLSGTFIPIGDAADDAADNYYENVYDADPSREGVQAWHEDEITFEEVTGRLVLDYKPSDNMMFYASYSRGYKSGGFNAPVDPTISSIYNIPNTFRPEFVNAFEVGSKNVLMEGRLLANLSAFYYDYEGLQISRKVARATVNENVDAKIWGLEGEFVFKVTESLFLNFTAAHLNTEIGDFALVDSRDPSAGEAGHIVIKDLANANNCVVLGMPAAVFTQLTGTPTVQIPGLESPGAFSSCASLQAAGFNVSPGVEVNVSGNELPYAPKWKFSFGLQYRHELTNGQALLFRTDYTRQDETWSYIYNDSRRDRIQAWDMWNMSLTWVGEQERWHVKGFVQNALNNDYITGQYTSGEGAGLGTRVTMLDPRLFGLEFGIRF